MNEQHHIILPEPTLRRLPWYLAYIDILKAQGVKTISSTKIAKAINVDSSIIAKDLSFLNVRGKTRIGYEVATLSDVLTEFLGFRHSHKAVVVGVGSLGASLIHDTGLANYGLEIVAGFDTNPDLIGSEICNIPIFDMKDFRMIRENSDATIGILTVPFTSAQDVADTMVAAGIKAIWNFTPCRVRTSEGIVMTSTSIYAHLALIYNRLEAIRSL